jgi:hypothetical protein
MAYLSFLTCGRQTELKPRSSVLNERSPLSETRNHFYWFITVRMPLEDGNDSMSLCGRRQL